MKRTWTIIGVGDVPASLKWYQALFGQPATLPAHDYFGQILDSDGTVLLCLHEWGAHEHPSAHPGQQQGRRFPSLRLEQPHSIRRLLVSAFLADSIQHIHSLRASGVISSHAVNTCGSDVSAFLNLRALRVPHR
jgi:hypothetical protein